MGRTSIHLTSETKKRLDRRKTQSESYDEAINRILDDEGVLHTEEDIRAIVRDEAERLVPGYNGR